MWRDRTSGMGGSVACRRNGGAASEAGPALVSSTRPSARSRRPFASRSVTLDDPSSRPPSGSDGARKPAPGLRDQLLATRDAALGLAHAHVDLARTELSAIAGQVGRVAALIAGAIVVVILAGLLGVIGGALFLGEWLLGSLGWGVLHGILAFVGIAVAAGLMAVGIGGGRLARSFGVGLGVAIVLGVTLGFEWPNQLYAAIGDSVRLNVGPADRPLVVGLLVGALLGALVGIGSAVRIESGGSRLAAIVGLAVVGLVLGAFSAITFGPQVGAAVGITAGYLTWIALMGVDVARNGVDIDGLKERFYPSQTIDTGKETLEWLQKRMPPGIGS
jgi:hypothetical protein